MTTVRSWGVSISLWGAACLALSSCSTPDPMPWELSQEETMQRLAAASAVGSHHEHMVRMVGEFDTTMTVWSGPGSEPMVSQGKAINEMVLGGRYLQTEFHGDFMGEKFEGLSLMAYDNATERYKTLWIDSWSTDLPPHGVGVCNEDGSVFTTVQCMDDILTGHKVVMRNVITLVDADHYRFEMFSTYPGHDEFKSVAVEYTRSR